jgi:hypothetical protein
MNNTKKIVNALQAAGFSNIQTVKELGQGVWRDKVLGDLRRSGTLYTLQMSAGAEGEYTAVFPALLTGDGDFPRVDRVYDPVDGCAFNGVSNPNVIIKAALHRIGPEEAEAVKG